MGAAATGAMMAASRVSLASAADARIDPKWMINGERLNANMAAFAQIGRNADGGSDRVAYSDDDVAGRAFLAEQMKAAGLKIRIDEAGNLIGYRKGTADAQPIMTGSHSDSVPNGGHYDGPLGVMAGIEVAHRLNELGHVTHHPLEVVGWANEEGGKTGSRAMIGSVAAKEYGIVTASGRTIEEGIAHIGGTPDKIDDVVRKDGDLAGYIELHVEQGGILDAEGISVGAVEGIVGIKRWNIAIDGFANHAGTTPMDIRQDAMLIAADVVKEVNRIIRGEPGRQVGTVGRIQAFPGAPNVVPGRVEMSLEIRDLSMAKVDRLQSAIAEAANRVAAAGGGKASFDHFYTSNEAPADPRVQNLVTDAANLLGLSNQVMPSGAGHDAQSIAKITPMGMIFVPSVGGISHNPAEFTKPVDVANGGNMLLRTMLGMDAMIAEG